MRPCLTVPGGIWRAGALWISRATPTYSWNSPMGRRARGDRRTPIPPDQPNYTIRAAALRVDRSTRTIERWVHDMVDPLPHRKVGGVVVIDHGPLMERYRAKFKKGTAHG